MIVIANPPCDNIEEEGVEMALSAKKLEDYGEVLLYQKKCYLGLPMSFTHYIATKDRLYIRKGVITVREERVELFRILDFSFTQTLFDRIYKQGDLIIRSNDASCPEIRVSNIKEPRKAWKRLEDLVIEARKQYNMFMNV